MKSFVLYSAVLAVISTALSLPSCSKKENDAYEGRWRVTDKQEYTPNIDEATLDTSLAELEKLLYAPLFYFEENPKVRGFSQRVTISVQSKVDEDERRLELAEQALYSSDGKGNFKLSYQNERNEGYDIIWKDGFLYRKMLGGEYTRTFSAGEHAYYRESQFNVLPDIAAMLRNHAKIEKSAEVKLGGEPCRHIVVRFTDAVQPVADLPQKRYLQNSFGLEEMRNDRMIADFASKKLDKISGTLSIFLASDNRLMRMVLDLTFRSIDDNVTITVNGERELKEKPAEQIAVPQFVSEYHRRSLDARKNIMEVEQHDK